MRTYYANLTIPCLWQFKEYPHIKVTKCQKIINEKTGKLISYNTRGFFVEGKYYKRNDVRNAVEKIN
jgi:hypothetical protein